MKKMKHPSSKILVLTLGLISVPLAPLLYTTSASAQTETDASSKPVPPSAPLLSPAPDFSQWKVSFTYPEEHQQNAGASPARVETRTRTIITTKTQNIIHEETIGAQGDTRDDWYIGDVQYAKLPSSSAWYQAPAKGAFPPSGFRDLDWITEDNYIGTTNYAGHPCLIFVPASTDPVTARTASQLLENLEALPTVAYIDAESRLPVQVRQSGIVRVYQFMQPPSEMLSPPADLADSLKKAAEIQARFSKPLQSNQ